MQFAMASIDTLHCPIGSPTSTSAPHCITIADGKNELYTLEMLMKNAIYIHWDSVPFKHSVKYP